MVEVEDYLTYKCNGCGYRYADPQYCFHCGTPECPACKRAGCITNVVNMGQIVSSTIPQRASEIKYVDSKINKPKSKKKTAKKKKKSIAELMEDMGVT